MPLVSEAQWAEYKRLRRLAGYPDDQYPSAHEATTAGEARAVADEFETYAAGLSESYHRAAVYWMGRAEAAERASAEGPACDTAWDRVQRLEARVTLLEAERPPRCGKPGLDGFACRLPSGHGGDHWFARVDIGPSAVYP